MVVLPQPDGPKIAYLFPFSQVIENGFNAYVGFASFGLYE
jgi:hypothetical protein